PAAQTKRIPTFPAFFMTLRNVSEELVPDQLALIALILTPRFLRPIAYLIARTASAVLPPMVPSVRLPMNLSDISFTFQATPTVPIPLFPTAPIVPATWVP